MQEVRRKLSFLNNWGATFSSQYTPKQMGEDLLRAETSPGT